MIVLLLFLLIACSLFQLVYTVSHRTQPLEAFAPEARFTVEDSKIYEAIKRLTTPSVKSVPFYHFLRFKRNKKGKVIAW